MPEGMASSLVRESRSSVQLLTSADDQNGELRDGHAPTILGGRLVFPPRLGVFI
jgi:hypothetical protein